MAEIATAGPLDSLDVLPATRPEALYGKAIKGVPIAGLPSGSGSLTKFAAIGADGATTRAYHPRPERRHRQVVRVAIGAQDGPVVALSARHGERPHAVLLHVAEVHRTDR